MIAKKAASSSGGRAASTTKKVRPARKRMDMTDITRPSAPAAHKEAVVVRKSARARPALPEKADDFSDVMEALDRVSVKNDELTVRINRLVSSLR